MNANPAIHVILVPGADALMFAEVLHAAGVPAGVFNLVNGDALLFPKVPLIS